MDEWPLILLLTVPVCLLPSSACCGKAPIDGAVSAEPPHFPGPSHFGVSSGAGRRGVELCARAVV